MPAGSAPEATVRASPQETERDSYVARALANPRPAGLEGRRLVSVGSGFYIARDMVLTNFHVAGSCAAVTVGNDSEGAETVARVLAGDAALDLALLGTPVASAEPAQFETALYTETGLELAIVGYPEHGLPVRQAELNPVSARPRDLVADQARFRFDGAVRRGNSGGPLLDDSGAVLGVVTQKIDTVAVYERTGQVVDDIGIAIANRTVFDFLRANKVSPLPALPGESLAPDRLLRKARGFVRQIGCWR